MAKGIIAIRQQPRRDRKSWWWERQLILNLIKSIQYSRASGCGPHPGKLTDLPEILSVPIYNGLLLFSDVVGRRGRREGVRGDQGGEGGGRLEGRPEG